MSGKKESQLHYSLFIDLRRVYLNKNCALSGLLKLQANLHDCKPYNFVRLICLTSTLTLNVEDLKIIYSILKISPIIIFVYIFMLLKVTFLLPTLSV